MKKSSLKHLVVGTVSSIGITAAPLFAHASAALDKLGTDAKKTADAAGVTGGTTDLPTLIGRIIAAALGLMGVILVCIIIYAGFLWMTAQGNEEKVKMAKKMISNAVVGMVLVFGAYAVTDWVIKALVTSVGTA